MTHRTPTPARLYSCFSGCINPVCNPSRLPLSCRVAKGWARKNVTKLAIHIKILPFVLNELSSEHHRAVVARVLKGQCLGKGRYVEVYSCCHLGWYGLPPRFSVRPLKLCGWCLNCYVLPEVFQDSACHCLGNCCWGNDICLD